MRREDLIELIRVKEEIARRKAEESLYVFTKYMWDVIEPNTPFVDGWHVQAICEHLEAVVRFDISKLIINVPPRHMKSIACSVMLAPWVWLKAPERRFLYASYSQTLSGRDSLKSRDVIRSPKYQKAFNPNFRLRSDQDTKSRFDNDRSGFRFSTSVGGTVTGEGGDYIIADDPLSANSAYSEADRDRVNDWWTSTMSTRANNPKQVGRVIIMQRLHENDLTGHLLAEEKGYELLNLPARFDPKIKSFTTLPNRDPRTIAGELLWPERFDERSLTELEKDLGSAAASAQLQQDPKPADGGMIKRSWWQYYNELPEPGEILTTATFWDCAQKVGVSNDFTVGATWIRTAKGFFLKDIIKVKVESPALYALIRTKYAEHSPDAIVIEDKSSGSAVIQYLRTETTLPVIPYDPGQKDKVVRASAAAPTIEAGKCYLPFSADWVETFISEHERFPFAAHDDQVDTTSMMREFFVNQGASAPRIRTL